MGDCLGWVAEEFGQLGRDYRIFFKKNRVTDSGTWSGLGVLLHLTIKEDIMSVSSGS